MSTPVVEEVVAPNGQLMSRTVVTRPGAMIEFVHDPNAWKKQVPAWVISTGLHVILVAVFLIGIGTIQRPKQALVAQNIQSDVPDDPDKNLIEDSIGQDPDRPADTEIEREADVPVVGPSVPDDPVGVENQEQKTPVEVIPPGFQADKAPGTEKGPEATALVGTDGGGVFGSKAFGAFAGRSGASRDRAVKAGGGNSESEAAVARGLAWLARQQKGNGSWVTDGQRKDPIAGTGLALLPFLAAGQTHKAKPSKYVKKEYVEAVARGLIYLKTQQKPGGGFPTDMYGQGIATIALCEAYGMTRDPSLLQPAQYAIEYIQKAQHNEGGWRYQPGTPGDTSVTGWQLQALKSGEMARLSVSKDKLRLVGVYLDSVSGNYGATYGYQDKNATPAMTAVGLLCRQYLGWGPRNPSLAKGVEYLKKHPPPDAKARDYDLYYFYYATQVLHFYGGDDWKTFWNPKMRDFLIKKQIKGQCLARDGSWDRDTSITGNTGGRLTMSCLALLTLEVYYRHLPLYQRTDGVRELEAGL